MKMSQEQPIKDFLESIQDDDDIKVYKVEEIYVPGNTKQAHSDEIISDAVDQNANVVVADQIGSVGIQLVKQGNQTDGGLLGEQPDNRMDITIGEALEATGLTSGRRPVDYSDAAAIEAAEVRATGQSNIVPGGIADAAQSAATRNARVANDADKTTLGEILSNASGKLPSDKAVSRHDAEGVIGVELRHDPNLSMRSGGIAASLTAAARLNQSTLPDNK